MNWTPAQIINLAPDPASAKAGQGLANLNKWQGCGINEQVAWGLCQGSGKDPYRTQIELGEPAFKCSCPSRKFPCKHGLGLFLLLASQPQHFKAAAQPDWVSEWLASRAKRSEQKAAKAEAIVEKPVDEQAQTKRAEAREKKVAAGIADLQLWMNDLIRSGLAHAQSQPYSFWERPAARLVDAQAPGLARMVRELAAIPSSGEGWQSRMLACLGKLQLLLDGYQRIETLSPETQADICSAIGWTFDQKALLQQSGVQDVWIVLGLNRTEDNSLRSQRVWLYAEKTEIFALIVQFAYGSSGFPDSFVPGQKFKSEFVFYPSAYPLRALLKSPREPYELFATYHVCKNFEAAFEHYAQALAAQPWIEQFPFSLRKAWPYLVGERGWLRDESGAALPIHPQFTNVWRMRSISGGHPLTVFGEWDGEYFLPLRFGLAEGFVSAEEYEKRSTAQ